MASPSPERISDSREVVAVAGQVGFRALTRARIPLVAGCLTLAAVLGTSFASFSVEEPLLFLVPFARAVEESAFDGVVGTEWQDAVRYEVTMGQYAAEVLLKHDGTYFYIAVVIATEREFSGGFECYAVFDNGDGSDYSLGDDMILAAAEDRLLAADYYYSATYDFRPDASVGGTDNAYGIGSYDRANRRYVFEFRREIASADEKDVALEIGTRVTAIYGWASY